MLYQSLENNLELYTRLLVKSETNIHAYNAIMYVFGFLLILKQTSFFFYVSENKPTACEVEKLSWLSWFHNDVCFYVHIYYILFRSKHIFRHSRKKPKTVLFGTSVDWKLITNCSAL